MAFLIGGANTLDDAYEISNSCRFNNDDSTLIKSFDAAGNRRTFTVSTWVKLGDLASGKITGTQTGGDNYFFIGNKDNGQFTIQQGDNGIRVATVALNRDPSAWYHTVFAFDTTQGTDTNRVKIYVNGVLADVCRPEAFTTAADYPNQNLELYHNMTTAFGVGCRGDGDNPLEGSLSEFYFIDGTQYAASNFGEFNNNGVWIPKEAKDDLTFGTNGFYLEFKQTGTSQNSSGIGADTSGNDNHFAVANLGATDVTVDTPTNNFCTLNPLDAGGLTSFDEGNCKLTYGGTSGQGDQQKCGATMGVANGKWYWEMKSISGVSMLGVMAMAHTFKMRDDDGYDEAESNGQNSMYANNGTIHTGQTNSANWGNAYTDDDIIGVALDMDNQYVYFSKNGTFQDSGDPTSGSNGTGASDYRPSAFNGDSSWGPFFQNAGSSTASVCEVNFGNPPFALSSGNADANGFGDFEYAPPSGYFALCTKNLAEFG